MKITINNLDDVRKAKRQSIETAELKGYELIENLFCDSSGFGQDDEAAYSIPQWQRRVEEIVKENGTVYAFITDAGQFQVYLGLFRKVSKSRAKRIANNTLKIETDDGYAIRLHDTDILTFKGNTVTLNNGGWYTVTTKQRLNQYLPYGISVYQKDYEWYVKQGDKTIEYKNGLTLEV